MYPSEDEIEFLLETAGDYLVSQPTRDDILSKFAGVRPLISRSNTTNTAKLSRSHKLYIDDNGLITITGGKWTTYRQMAEEAVDAAINVGHLSATECVTKTLPVDAPPPSTGSRLHVDLPYTTGDIERAIRSEMAMKVEDVLARRTRALFLNASAARELGVQIAEILGIEHDRNDDQISEDAIWFDTVAKGYL